LLFISLCYSYWNKLACCVLMKASSAKELIIQLPAARHSTMNQ